MKTIAFAALATVAFASPALADAPRDVRSVEVQYSDLDLTNPRDAERMLTRVDRAAARACGESTMRMSVEERREFRACKQETTARAVTRLGAPEVLAAYNDKVGGTPYVIAAR